MEGITVGTLPYGTNYGGNSGPAKQLNDKGFAMGGDTLFFPGNRKWDVLWARTRASSLEGICRIPM